MSTPDHAEVSPAAAAAATGDRMGAVPAPPGGHALRIDPRRIVSVPPLPVVEEVSAGGLVIRQGRRTDAAVIARRNRGGRLEWCLPKGHLEGAETPEQAAVREISEETGILGTVRGPLGVIDYWFSGEDRRVHKVVHHFLLDAVGGSLTIDNDPDGEAEEVAWINLEELPERLSYPNERRLVFAAATTLGVRPIRPVRMRRAVPSDQVATEPIPTVARSAPRSPFDAPPSPPGAAERP